MQLARQIKISLEKDKATANFVSTAEDIPKCSYHDDEVSCNVMNEQKVYADETHGVDNEDMSTVLDYSCTPLFLRTKYFTEHGWIHGEHKRRMGKPLFRLWHVSHLTRYYVCIYLS